jgi:hypothetical protein
VNAHFHESWDGYKGANIVPSFILQTALHHAGQHQNIFRNLDIADIKLSTQVDSSSLTLLDMSGSMLSGFTWPTAAPGAPQANQSVVSPSATLAPSTDAPTVSTPMASQPAVTSASLAPLSSISLTAPQPTVTSGSGAPAVSFPVEGSQPSAPIQPGGSANVSQSAPLIAPSGPRTVRVTITSTVTASPDTPTMVAVAHALDHLSQTDSSHITSIVFVPLPDVTGVVFQMYEPISGSSQQDQASSSNSKAITGGILGAVGAVVIIILLIVSCKGRCGGNRSRAERGRARHAQDIVSHSRGHRGSRRPRGRRHYHDRGGFEVAEGYPVVMEYPVPVARPVLVVPSDLQRHQSYRADSPVSPL